ncbi:MAG: phosphoribosylaminoimidazolesuccinocarboxamide synthase [Chloroflexi bacterium]|nr:MAG: phosphoribosylaminoimidazolesuccinocarboxamide synthase [Chloroflexota bacterium]
MSVLLESNLPCPLLHRGKVRDNYDLGDFLLMVATDRISAFDVVLPCGIPGKGVVLNQLSLFWFEKTAHMVPNHVIEGIADVAQLKRFGVNAGTDLSCLAERSTIVRKAERIPVECVVRGYISGSAWAEYSRKGTVNGEVVPSGLRESQRLSPPLFTPSTKAENGHDEPLTRRELVDLVGQDLADELAEKSLAVYSFAHEYAWTRGIIVADTKFEFGIVDGQVILIDEVLTPDSSRFWDADDYKVGQPQEPFDKQMVRDWLSASGWNKEPPAPMLPHDLIQRTAERYREVYRRLTGSTLHE